MKMAAEQLNIYCTTESTSFEPPCGWGDTGYELFDLTVMIDYLLPREQLRPAVNSSEERPIYRPLAQNGSKRDARDIPSTHSGVFIALAVPRRYFLKGDLKVSNETLERPKVFSLLHRQVP